MAFAVANLQNQNSMSPGLGTYIYKSDTDVYATVAAVGYFNNTDDVLNLAVDDRIIVTGDQGGYELVVVSISSGAVTTGVREIPALPVAIGAALTLVTATHNGKTFAFDTAAGSIATLPAATGSGAKFRFQVTVLATTNGHEVKTVGTDEFVGYCLIIDVDTADATIAFAAQAADDFDRILFNRSTTGLATPGDWIEVEDIAAGVWAIKGAAVATGSVATPFIST